MMNFKRISVVVLFGCCCTVAFATTKMKDKNNKSKERGMALLVGDDFSELMANKVEYKKEVLVKELASMDDLILERQLELEELMFPADELYESNWENQWVDPFARGKFNYPDSATIDCSTFVMPIDIPVRITSHYGPRRRRMHKGIDLKVHIGDTIRAAFSGKVRVKSYDRRGYGHYLVIRHPNGLETVYGHLSEALVEENQVVRAGDVIGLGGNTGRSTGSHLHFETRFLGQALNPAEIIDFRNGVPHKDDYVFRNVKINGRKSNIYTSGNTHPIHHRVKSGETLGAIARKYKTSVSELCRLNGMKSTAVLRIGQQLHVGTVILTAKDHKANDATTTASTNKKTDSQ